jgi:choline monooxygenase
LARACAADARARTLLEQAPTLTEWLGDLVPWLTDYEEALKAGELIATHRTSYDIKANWKLLIENFLEYYHLPAVHPALCNVSGVDEHQRYQGKGMYMGFATHPLTVGGTAIDPGQAPPRPHPDAPGTTP